MFCCLTSHSQIFDHEEVSFVGEDLKKYMGERGLQQLAVTVAQSVRAFASEAESRCSKPRHADLSCQNWL